MTREPHDPALCVAGRRVLVRLWLAVAVALAAAALAASPAAADGTIVDRTVTFTVQHLNRTAVSCPTTGGTFTVKGHLVAPRNAIAGDHRAITLLLHGATAGSGFVWRNKAAPGYDYALEMAKLGHASVVVDQLGYGRSDILDGNTLCEGTQADVAHQIVGKLRTGNYTVEGMNAPFFPRVALAGISLGGAIAEIEAYSFHDVDAMINMTWSDGDGSPLFAEEASKFLSRCALGGQPKYAGGPGGYAWVWDDVAPLYQSAQPAMIAEHRRIRELDPCALATAYPEMAAFSRTMLSTITEPVLLVFGKQDRAWQEGAGEKQRARFTGSSDVSLSVVENAGHVPILEAPAPQVRATVSSWLKARGF